MKSYSSKVEIGPDVAAMRRDSALLPDFPDGESPWRVGNVVGFDAELCDASDDPLMRPDRYGVVTQVSETARRKGSGTVLVDWRAINGKVMATGRRWEHTDTLTTPQPPTTDHPQETDR